MSIETTILIRVAKKLDYENKKTAISTIKEIVKSNIVTVHMSDVTEQEYVKALETVKDM